MLMNLLFLLLCFIVLQCSGYPPLVIYHGLGDTSTSPKMLVLIGKLQSVLPGIFIHAVQIGKNSEEDRKKSLLDNMNRQIDEVCDQLGRIEELKEGFNAIGLSQGGQFIRAYVERCNTPKVLNLITLGSQHQGVMSLPGCTENDENKSGLTIENTESDSNNRDNNTSNTTNNSQSWFRMFSVKNINVSDGSWFKDSLIGQIFYFFKNNKNEGNCAWWKKLMKMGVYSPIVRSQVVQAQYFKDPSNLRAYYENNQFLLNINNDHPDPKQRNPTYAENMKKLQGFYMYMFEEDSVVIPRESSWFALKDPTSLNTKIKFLTDQKEYQQDLLGLKTLNERGALYFRKLPGEHLQLSTEFVEGELADLLR